MSLQGAYTATLIGLSLLVAVLQVLVCKGRLFAWRPSSLELAYFGGYILCASADWLQGPYVYALYEAYGYTHHEISTLFVVGFASSGLMGPFVGQVADRYGRRRTILLLYCGCYTLACTTKHFNVFAVLAIGRVLSGVATSTLFSCFESWIVTESVRHKYDVVRGDQPSPPK